MIGEHSRTIAFRIPAEHLAVIAEKAEREAGGNFSKAAREVLALGVKALQERQGEAHGERVPA